MERNVSWETIFGLLGLAILSYIKSILPYLDFENIQELPPPPRQLQEAILSLMDIKNQAEEIDEKMQNFEEQNTERRKLSIEQLRLIEKETSERNRVRREDHALALLRIEERLTHERNI